MTRQLGGALRQRVPVALAMPLDAVTAVPEDVRHVVLASAERDVGKLIAQLDAAAGSLGKDVSVALQLDGQLPAEALGMLRHAGRELKLGYIADPCADLVTACRAFGRGAPPLAISAHRHATARAGACDARRRRAGAAGRAGAGHTRACGRSRLISPAWNWRWSLAPTSSTPHRLPHRCARRRSRWSFRQRIRGDMMRSTQRPAPADHAHHAASRVGADAAALCQRAVYAPHHRAHHRRAGNRRRHARLRRDQRHRRGRCSIAPHGTETAGSGSARSAAAAPGDGRTDGRVAQWPGGLAALAGLDMALFDWAGRHFNMPIWQLLGGSGERRDFEAVAHIPALLLDEPVDRRELPRLFADPAQRAADRGSRAAPASRSRLHRVQDEMHRHQPRLGRRASSRAARGARRRT